MNEEHETNEDIVFKKASYYQNHAKEQETNTERTNVDWYQTIHDHYRNKLTPVVTNNNEHFIEYFPAKLSWGESSRLVPKASGRLNQSLRGQYGTGYICFSDEKVYISVFDELTKKYPAKLSGVGGFLANILADSGGGEVDDRIPYKNDNTWVMNYSSIIGTLCGQESGGGIEFFLIKTATVDWKIYEHFIGTQKEIMLITQMGIEGKLSAIWNKRTNRKEEDVFSTIKKLKELLDAGIIDIAEFEEKKLELLRKI